jgi:hypothetical protein
MTIVAVEKTQKERKAKLDAYRISQPLRAIVAINHSFFHISIQLIQN